MEVGQPVVVDVILCKVVAHSDCARPSVLVRHVQLAVLGPERDDVQEGAVFRIQVRRLGNKQIAFGIK